MTQIEKQAIRPQQADLSTEIQDVYCHVDGRRIHYQVAGPLNAPPLVLIHGIGGWTNWWHHNFPAFSPHYRTYALDLPGFGRTRRLAGRFSIEAGADFVEHWLDFVGLEQTHLLGHSMGGQISLRLAARRPDRVKKLILAAPSGVWMTAWERLLWFRQMPKVMVPLTQTMTIASGTMRTDTIAFAASLLAVLKDRQDEKSLEQLRVPTLLLWGTADGIVPPALGSRMLEKLVNASARLEFIERGTHNMMYDQSQAFNRLVLEFLG